MGFILIQNVSNMRSNKKQLSLEQSKELLSTLRACFKKNMHRHKAIEWYAIQARLEANNEKLWSLNCISQRCRILLSCQGLPWLAKGINY